MKDDRANIKIDPELKDRLKVACAKTRETYSQWIDRKLQEKETKKLTKQKQK